MESVYLVSMEFGQGRTIDIFYEKIKKQYTAAAPHPPIIAVKPARTATCSLHRLLKVCLRT
jgi:hypothetical protein